MMETGFRNANACDAYNPHLTWLRRHVWSYQKMHGTHPHTLGSRWSNRVLKQSKELATLHILGAQIAPRWCDRLREVTKQSKRLATRNA